MRYLVIVACLCFATTSHAAQSAQNANSVYGGVFGGLTILPDITLSAPGFLPSTVEMDAGYNLGGVIGYKWAMGLRAEGEISYRQNDIDNVDGIATSGDVSSLTFMGNAWYDFNTGTPWIPYIGGGLGLASVGVDTPGFDESDTVFAYQIGGGVGFEVSPGIVISADYRYLATTDPEFEVGGLKIDAEYSSHNLMVGVRGHF